MLIVKAGKHKMLVRRACREDPVQTASADMKKQVWSVPALFVKAFYGRQLVFKI